VEHLGFRPVFDSGWYVQLEAPSGHRPQLGLVEQAHPTVPAGFGLRPAGVLIAVEVDDVDAVHARARAAGLDVALSLRDEDFGQRHFMVVDPDGLLVDVITPIEPDPHYATMYLARRDTRAGSASISTTASP
jgi:catechol 2,3-dioxygenase-like lactoylglutathione lyase family enzyme